MALEGLLLKKSRRVFCIFEKAEPRRMKYRLIPVPDMPMTLQMKKASAEKGWDYVTSYSVFSIYSSPVEANAPEWTIQPEDFARKLKRLSDRTFVAILGLILSTVSQVSQSLRYMDLSGQDLLGSIIFFIIAIILVVNSIFKLSSVKTLKKSLLAGNPIDHAAPWQKIRKYSLAKSVVFCLGVLPFFIFQFIKVR